MLLGAALAALSHHATSVPPLLIFGGIWLALGLAIIVTAALFGGNLAVHVGQPAVLGELLAGMLLGNLPGLGRLQFLGADPYLDILSEYGPVTQATTD